ncbi:MAG: HAMP domain-containing sensor histidine kinase [Sulfurimonas sp.]|nr:HAMP domain-containing sensor histidine kinase [Sulfurimonas sp.]
MNFSDKQESSTDVALGDVVKRVVRYYGELSSAKGIKVQTDIGEASLHIIESRAELLFSNLLSNAIKYSMPESTISITLKEGLFIIKDEGVGIAQNKLDAIFELYNRNSNIAGGFGVGLNIVKQICDSYKIKVEVKSTLGEGSEFRLLF